MERRRLRGRMFLEMRSLARVPAMAAGRCIPTVLAISGMLASATACTTAIPSPTIPAGSNAVATSAAARTPAPTRIEHRSQDAVSTGTAIDLATLSGRIVFDDFEDVYAMDIDGTNAVEVANDPEGPEFDGAWSPDGKWIVYRDSTRGINQDDEIYIASADGTERRNLTNAPSQDWGPDWSPDGSTIAFNSDRETIAGLTGWLVEPDGANLRRIEIDEWFEYPSFSPDGSEIAFMGGGGGDYDIHIVDLTTKAVTRLTTSPGSDGWPAWSPDGRTIAFTSIRDDCGRAPWPAECWSTGDIGPHHDIWLIDVDGTNLRRVTPEFGQFVAWSPDGQYLLISGYALYVVRPDGTGRVEIRTDTIDHALGGIPDWRAP
jgi:Tol biopolymer transport system component